ncbi:MAG TPA: hypothetical protein VJQ82_05735 [Terriglobales bacterium]|nr:hypothetical protein [Terriglobales bacterium]
MLARQRMVHEADALIVAAGGAAVRAIEVREKILLHAGMIEAEAAPQCDQVEAAMLAVAITATVRRRVTEDRVSVSIPSYGFPHSIFDKMSKVVKKGEKRELVGDVIHVDEGKVTVDIGGRVTVDADTVRLVKGYKPPVDEPD